MNPEKQQSVFLRDYMAEYRTLLANKRTFLSYMRTALSVIVAGMAFIKFFDHPVTQVLGWVFLPVGLAIILEGIFTYNRISRMIKAEQARALDRDERHAQGSST